MGSNGAPLIADLFLYMFHYEAEFIQKILKEGRKKSGKQVQFQFQITIDEFDT